MYLNTRMLLTNFGFLIQSQPIKSPDWSANQRSPVNQSEKTITELEILFHKVIHPKEPFHLFRASFFVPYNIELLVAPFLKKLILIFQKNLKFETI